MEVSHEISQKIRSAIKAKLMELGAYVDDELPDYIMVMVANKRSRAQMNKDLSLFLGPHTSSFTEWLHALLGKLQTIRNDVDKSVDKQGKGGKLKAVRDKEKVDRQLAAASASKQDKNNVDDSKVDNFDGMDGGIQEKNKCKQEIDSRETVSFPAKQKIKCENDIEVGSYSLTDGSQTDAIPEEVGGELVDNDVVVTTVHPGVDTKTAVSTTVPQSPGRVQARKRKMPPDLTDASKAIDSRSQSPAFDNTTSGLITDKLPLLPVTSHSPDASLEVTAHDHKTEAMRQDDKFLQKPGQDDRSLCKCEQDGPSLLKPEQSSQTLCRMEQDSEPPQKHMRLAETVNLEEIKLALAEVLERNTVLNDDITHFCKMLESSLRKLRPQDLSLAKLRIQQVLCEFETIAVQDNSRQHTNKLRHTSCLGDSKCNNEGRSSRTSDSIFDNSECVLGNRHAVSSLQSNCVIPQEKEMDDSSEMNSLSVRGRLTDSTNLFQPEINSASLENHLTVNCDNSASVNKVNSLSHIEKVVFHPTVLNSRKLPTGLEMTDSYSKVSNSAIEFGEKDSALLKHSDRSPQAQSPVLGNKIDLGSPSSVHSCPPSSTLSLRIKRNVSSASRESTISPIDLLAKPGFSYTTKTKQASTKNTILPSILVDSIHSRRRCESTESASVLRQSLNKDRSPRPVDSAKQDSQDSPRHYGPEALKVMAKNLRITVINKQAVRSSQESSSDDSDEDDDDDSSDDEEEDDGVSAKVKKSAVTKVKMNAMATKKKSISGQSTS